MKPNFIVADTYVSQSFGVPHIVMMSNLSFWLPRVDELQTWCKEHNCRIEGMTVSVPDEHTLTLFALKWS